MSNFSVSRSTIFPLPSSPHWAPITTMFAMTCPRQRSAARTVPLNSTWTQNFTIHSRRAKRVVAELIAETPLEMLVNNLGNRFLGRRTHDLLFDHSVFEEQQGRNSLDVIAR